MKQLALLLGLLSPDPAKLEFDRIQEDWIAEQMTVGSLHRSLPPIYRALGSSKYHIRQASEVSIKLLGPWAIRDATRATHHFSPEVRMRATRIVDAIYQCKECLPDPGKCMLCYPEGRYECPCDWQNRCLKCEGSGDLRYKNVGRRWVDGNWMEVYEHRNLFNGH